MDGAVALLVLELVQAELEPEVSACRALGCPSKCWDTDRLGWFRVAGDSEGPKAAGLLVGGSTSQPSKQQGLRCPVTDAEDWRAGPILMQISYREDSKMVIARTSVLVEETSQNRYQDCVSPG